MAVLRIDQMGCELRAAGHEVVRDYVLGTLEGTFDGEGWVVRVGGEGVATAASIGSLEERLRWWVEDGNRNGNREAKNPEK